MKRTLCLTAAFALTATAAFGQPMDGNILADISPDRLGTSVVFREVSGGTTEAAGLIDLVRRALDKSRSLHLVPVRVPKSMEVQAPLSMIKDASGKRVTVTYDVSPPNDAGGGGRVYSVTCTTTQLDRCAEDIARRAERVAREAEFLRDN